MTSEEFVKNANKEYKNYLTVMESLYETYKKEIKPKLHSELKIKNVMQVPELRKIVVNIGMGEALTNKKLLDDASAQMTLITGQKPMVTKARRAISAFKLRAGQPIGIKVTLRGKRMYDFLTKLSRVVLPRMRDFRGIDAKFFDGQGNLTIGFKDQIVFPEIEYATIDKLRGLEVTLVTSALNDEHGKKLLELLGIPFKKEEIKK